MSAPVNGHPSWISSTNAFAIWHHSKLPHVWMFGMLEGIGGDSVGILAKGMFFGKNETVEWRYRNGSGLQTPKENDIIVECVAREGEPWSIPEILRSLITGLLLHCQLDLIIQKRFCFKIPIL